MNITVLIPTFNCEQTILKTLNSVKWADQIVVVDSFSTDNTLKLIKPYKVNLYQKEYINSANQKNWALKYCHNDWIFQIDSDEEVDSNSRKIILEAIKNANDEVHCYMLPRKNHILGSWVKNGGLYPDWQYRLFKRKYGRWESKDVHANVIVSGRIEKLDLNIIHNGMPNISKQLSNLNRYTRYETDILIRKNIKFSYLKMILGPIYIFIKRYIFLYGFLDGWRGFFLATYTAIYYFFIHAKFLEAKILGLKTSPK